MSRSLTEYQIQIFLENKHLGYYDLDVYGKEFFVYDQVVLVRMRESSGADPGAYVLYGKAKGEQECQRLENLLRKTFGEVSNVDVKASVNSLVVKN
jgi:hypothetical protein